MKKKLLTNLIIIVFTSASFCYAQPSPSQSQTRFYLIKTNRLIGVAHMAVKRTQKYEGKLSLAVRHERKALALYNTSEYSKAIFHSKRSRVLCIEIFENNKIKLPLDTKFTPEEENFTKDIPDNSTLDNDLEKTALTDQELMNGNLNIDIK